MAIAVLRSLSLRIIYLMKTYQYILLDWDGNIAQTLGLWPDAIDIVLRKKYAVQLSHGELVKACGGVAAFLSSHTDLSVDEGKLVLEDATKIVKQRLPTVELYPDAADVLHTLKDKGKSLAVITSSIRSVVEPLLEKYEMKDLFDAVICIEDTKHRKPHAEPLLKALELIGGATEQALIVGDTEKDIVAGHNAGVDSVLFYPIEHQTYYSLDELKRYNPTYVISDFFDLVKMTST